MTQQVMTGAPELNIGIDVGSTTAKIVVTDNGTGFEPQRLEEVRRSLTAPQKDVRQSGLQSIARRLALLYGEESTITVESEYMVYTRVTLRMKRGEH